MGNEVPTFPGSGRRSNDPSGRCNVRVTGTLQFSVLNFKVDSRVHYSMDFDDLNYFGFLMESRLQICISFSQI
jgi:hypothetical protein